ncbi:hypothetical protein HDU93_005215 [Gonapodya sp. JEL0774]|nr:hypothetical protein HDU93_005215 [Gonapodya sp. JEL0774]
MSHRSNGRKLSAQFAGSLPTQTRSIDDDNHDSEAAPSTRIYFNRMEEAIAGVFYVMRGDIAGPTTRKSIAITVASFIVDFLQVFAITVGATTDGTVPGSAVLAFFDNGNIWRLLAEGQLNAFIAVQFILCALVLTVVGVTVYVAWSFKDRVVRWLWPVELLRLFVGVFVGAFLILITDTLLMPFQCDYIQTTFSSDYMCLSPIAVTLMASSLLALIFYLPLALLSAMLFFDYNPKAKRSESKAHGRAEVWNTVGRVIISIVHSAHGTPRKDVLSVILAVSLLSLGNGIAHAPFYHHYLNKLRAGTTNIVLAVCVLALAGGSVNDWLAFVSFVSCAFALGWVLADIRCHFALELFRKGHAKFASENTAFSDENIRVSSLTVSSPKQDFSVSQMIFETDFYLAFRHVVVSWKDMTVSEKVSSLAFLRMVYQKLDTRNGPEAGWFLFHCAVIEFHFANEIERSREYLARAKACRPPWDVVVALYSLSRDMQTAKEAAQYDGRPLSITEQMSHKKFFDAATGHHNAIYSTAHKLAKIMDLKRTSPVEVSTLTVELVWAVMSAEQSYALLCSEFPDNPLALRLRARLYDEVFHDSAEALRLEVLARELDRLGSPREFSNKGALSSHLNNSSKSSDQITATSNGSDSTTANRAQRGAKALTEEHFQATGKALKWIYLCLIVIGIVNISNQQAILDFFNSPTVELPEMPSNSTGMIYYKSPTQFSNLITTFLLAMRVISNYSYDHFQDAITSPELTFAVKYKADATLYEWCQRLIQQQALESDLALGAALKMNQAVHLSSLFLILGMGVLVISTFHFKFRAYNSSRGNALVARIFRHLGRKCRRALITDLARHPDIVVDFSKGSGRPVLNASSRDTSQVSISSPVGRAVQFLDPSESNRKTSNTPAVDIESGPSNHALILVEDKNEDNDNEEEGLELPRSHSDIVHQELRDPKNEKTSGPAIKQSSIVLDYGSQSLTSVKSDNATKSRRCSFSPFQLTKDIVALLFIRPYTRIFAACFALLAALLLVNGTVVNQATSHIAGYTQDLVKTQDVEYLSLKTLFVGMFVVDDQNFAMDQLVNGGDVAQELTDVTSSFASAVDDLVYGTPGNPSRDYGPRKELLFSPNCLLGAAPCHGDGNAYPFSDRAEQGLYMLVREFVAANNYMLAVYPYSNHIALADTTWQFIVNAARTDLK